MSRTLFGVLALLSSGATIVGLNRAVLHDWIGALIFAVVGAACLVGAWRLQGGGA